MRRLLRSVLLALLAAFAFGFGFGLWLQCQLEQPARYIG